MPPLNLPTYQYKKADGPVKLATDVAHILRTNGVACLLWGDLYLRLLGREEGDLSETVAFIVPDIYMQEAIDVLRAAGFDDTPASEHHQCACSKMYEEDNLAIKDRFRLRLPHYCFSEPGASQARANVAGKSLEEQFDELSTREELHIVLYLQSQYMWCLPHFGLDHYTRDSSHFMLPSGLGLPGLPPYRRNRFNPADPPVMVLTPTAYIEHMIYLHARESALRATDDEIVNTIAHIHLQCLHYQGEVFKDDHLDITNFSRFGDRARKLWMCYNAIETLDDSDAYIERIKRLGKELAEEGKLPKLPKNWTYKLRFERSER